jgi:hypothetical protein
MYFQKKHLKKPESQKNPLFLIIIFLKYESSFSLDWVLQITSWQ